MRTNKELLQIAIDNIELFTSTGCYGLCVYITELECKDIITYNERRVLRYCIFNYIKDPTWINKFITGAPNIKGYNNVHTQYFWEMGDVKPRLRYLKWLLKQESINE